MSKALQHVFKSAPRKPGKQEQLKILLLQNRKQKPLREEEFESFVSYSGLKKHQIDIINNSNNYYGTTVYRRFKIGKT